MQTDQTQIGDMPTTGGMRPGPVVGLAAADAPVDAPDTGAGARPVVIRIPAIQVDAEVERAFIVDGVMENPTGPFVVAWYGQTSRVGEPGNAVFAGHVDYVDVGDAVFARIGELTAGETIEVVSATGEQYAYAVEWVEIYPVASAPVDQILGQGDAEEVTLITCGGVFDGGEYSDRLIVRATRST